MATDADQQLIKAITEEVLRALQIAKGTMSRPICLGDCQVPLQPFWNMGIDRLGAYVQLDDAARRMAGRIDHTLLRADTTCEEIESLCRQGFDYGFASVCIPPTMVRQAHRLLEGSPTKVCTVVGFPLGYHATEVKVLESRIAIRDGAEEIDMVAHIAGVKSAEWNQVREDIHAVVEECHRQKAILKVILETALLSENEIRRLCQICVQSGADFVKTSTGFSKRGASIDDVKIMKEEVGEEAKIKAAGGISDWQKASAMVEQGASRIGASAGLQILRRSAAAGHGY